MDVIKFAIGCAAVGVVVGSGLSHLSPDVRDDLLASARAAVGVPAAPVRPAPAGASPERTAAPLPPASAGETVAADPRGQYQTAVEIEGERIPVVIDTGAASVALSFEDADRLGIRPMPSDFRLPIATANGRAFAAPVRLRSIRLGGIEVRDVDAIVAGRGQLGVTLLGMSFLSRLSGVAVDHGQLVLRQ